MIYTIHVQFNVKLNEIFPNPMEYDDDDDGDSSTLTPIEFELFFLGSVGSQIIFNFFVVAVAAWKL